MSGCPLGHQGQPPVADGPSVEFSANYSHFINKGPYDFADAHAGLLAPVAGDYPGDSDGNRPALHLRSD